MILFGAAICASAVFQFGLRRTAQKRLLQIEPFYMHENDENAKLDALKSELETERGYAELYTYLQHPWPRTQILGVIASTVPPAVTPGPFADKPSVSVEIYSGKLVQRHDAAAHAPARKS